MFTDLGRTRYQTEQRTRSDEVGRCYVDRKQWFDEDGREYRPARDAETHGYPSVPWTAKAPTFADVNGDGLKDLLFCDQVPAASVRSLETLVPWQPFDQLSVCCCCPTPRVDP